MTHAPHIVIVEDDVNLANGLKRLLNADGYRVDIAFNGEELADIMKLGSVDLVLLDLNLGHEDGMDIAPTLTEKGNTALIILTGRDTPSDCVSGLEAGADDYVTKPFEHEVLLARIRAVLRRRNRSLDALPVITAGTFQLDTVDRFLTQDGTETRVELTSKETTLLAKLMAHVEHPVHRSELARNQAWTPQERATDVHVSHIRQKLQAGGITGLSILPVRGHGYQLSLKSENALENPMNVPPALQS